MFAHFIVLFEVLENKEWTEGKNEAEELKRWHLKIFQMCMLTPAGMESSSPTSLR